MGSRFEMAQRRNDVRSMLTTSVPAKRIAPYLMERFDMTRSTAYRLIKEVSDELTQEMNNEQG